MRVRSEAFYSTGAPLFSPWSDGDWSRGGSMPRAVLKAVAFLRLPERTSSSCLSRAQTKVHARCSRGSTTIEAGSGARPTPPFCSLRRDALIRASGRREPT
jgi:hypothetical protein